MLTSGSRDVAHGSHNGSVEVGAKTKGGRGAFGNREALQMPAEGLDETCWKRRHLDLAEFYRTGKGSLRPKVR